jgi:hypothetical protein
MLGLGHLKLSVTEHLFIEEPSVWEIDPYLIASPVTLFEVKARHIRAAALMFVGYSLSRVRNIITMISFGNLRSEDFIYSAFFIFPLLVVAFGVFRFRLVRWSTLREDTMCCRSCGEDLGS